MSAVIRARGVRKSYLGTSVLHDISIDVDAGSLTVMSGPSGAGKTTLLNLVSALETPDTGTIAVAGVEVHALAARHRAAFRASLAYSCPLSVLTPILRGSTMPRPVPL